MLRLHKLNNDEIGVIPDLIGSGQDDRKVKGGHILDIFHNVFLCARKKSGKTSCIYKILKECAGKDTIVVLFVSTLYKDVGWQNIRKYLDMKHIDHVDYTSIKDEHGVDQLDAIIKDLEHDAEEEEKNKDKPKEKKKQSMLLCDGDECDDEHVKRKSKYRCPEFIFVFDDISNELKSKSLISLLKRNRHFKCSILLSSQYPLDLDPQSRKQIDTWLVFKGQPLAKLETIYKDADISIPFDEFAKIYKVATEKPYSFLNINTRNETFKRNFNTEIKIKSSDIV
jgi:hypothetical protein